MRLNPYKLLHVVNQYKIVVSENGTAVDSSKNVIHLEIFRISFMRPRVK